MATKKEKRAKALAKREAFMAQYRADGLAALAASKEAEAKKAAKAAAEVKKLKRGLSIAVAMEKLKSGDPDITVGENSDDCFKCMESDLSPTFSG